MNRRRLLQSIGLLAGGSAFSVGSGAFTSTSAQRTVDIAVADDEDAYLAMNPSSDSDYGRAAEFGDGQVIFSIPGFNESTPGDTRGEGVGPDSVYTFGELLTIRNQGDNTVEVWSKPGNLVPAIDHLSLIDSGEDGTVLDQQSNAVVLTPGESFEAGLFIDTGSDLGSFDVSLSILAEQPSTSGGSVPGGTSRQLGVRNATAVGPTGGDDSGVQFELVNRYRGGGPITITDVSITPADGDIDLVSDRQGGTNYDSFTFNADVHIEAMPQDGYVDAGGGEFQLPTTVDLESDGFRDGADQEAVLDPGTAATVNLYSFRDSDGMPVDMTGKRLDLSFTVELPDGTTDVASFSVSP
ncbi:hypothetical protein ACFR97_12495 [Haloplanus litoreus]|uniref:DUF1102 domain-containing protein n=1 Tax=Haloplanus litoreus TaxID=767515 RepID=A0ABD5ZYG8_9EURY